MLSLHAAGVQNVVATLGTALTMEQVRALKGLVGNGTIILVFDSDAAGIKAAHRSLELFWQVHTNFQKGDVFTEGGADTRILVLPDNHDPDSYIQEHGADAFLSLAEEAPGIIPFLLESAIGRFGTGTEGKIRVLAALAGPLAAVNDPVARSVYTKMLAERLEIDERAVVEKARQAVAADPGASEGKRTDQAEMTSGSGTDRVERQLVTMMIQFPEILDDVRRRRIVERFSDTGLQSAGMAILATDGAAPLDVAAVIGHIDDPATQALVSRLAMADEKWSREGCRRLMEQFESTYSRNHDQLVRQIKAAEADNDHDTLQRLLEEKLRRARGTHSQSLQGRTDTTERA
jgi:DNA primase